MALILSYFAKFGGFRRCDQTVDCTRFINVLLRFIFNAEACHCTVNRTQQASKHFLHEGLPHRRYRLAINRIDLA